MIPFSKEIQIISFPSKLLDKKILLIGRVKFFSIILRKPFSILKTLTLLSVEPEIK